MHIQSGLAVVANRGCNHRFDRGYQRQYGGRDRQHRSRHLSAWPLTRVWAKAVVTASNANVVDIFAVSSIARYADQASRAVATRGGGCGPGATSCGRGQHHQQHGQPGGLDADRRDRAHSGKRPSRGHGFRSGVRDVPGGCEPRQSVVGAGPGQSKHHHLCASGINPTSIAYNFDSEHAGYDQQLEPDDVRRGLSQRARARGAAASSRRAALPWTSIRLRNLAVIADSVDNTGHSVGRCRVESGWTTESLRGCIPCAESRTVSLAEPGG